MPLYEYKCDKCGNVEEVVQKFSDPVLEECPHCSGRLKKLISNNSFHLKGKGWYVTDYGKNPSGSVSSITTNPKDKNNSDSKSKDQ